MAGTEDEVLVRLIYNADGTITAEYQPGLANFSYWLYWKINADRWQQTGQGIWLGCQITPEEAEYIRRLTLSQWNDGRRLEVVGKPDSDEPIVMDTVEKVEPVKVDVQPDYGQMSLF